MSVSESLTAGEPAEAAERQPLKALQFRRFDACALASLQTLLVRLGHGLVGGLALLLLEAAQLWREEAAWSGLGLAGVLLVPGMMLLPVRSYRAFRTADRLALESIATLLGCVTGLLFLQAALCLAGLPALSAGAWLLLLGLLWLPAVLVRRLVERSAARWRRKLRLVIVGAGEQGVAVARYFSQHDAEVEIVGFIDDRRSRLDPQQLPYPLLATDTQSLEDLPGDIDGVILALPNQAGERVSFLASRLRGKLGEVYLAPDAPVLDQAFLARPNRGPSNMLLLGMNPLSLEGRLVKRLFDIAFSGLVLALFLPVGLLLGLLIRLESAGPALFTQRRYGRNNHLFDLYKFRSMRYEADAERKALHLTQRKDSRVTRLGSFLRRSSLDEMPQFINVLLGHMSVVGPRPHPPGVKAGERTYEKVVVDFAERYKVRPGITGWAQVNGLRGNTFTEESLTERFSYDVQYIQNWSLELDLWIVLRTVLGGFGGRNAF